MNYTKSEDRVVLRSMVLKELIQAECFQLEISSQEFVRQCVVDYFLRKYKFHPIYQRSELEQTMRERVMNRAKEKTLPESDRV